MNLVFNFRKRIPSRQASRAESRMQKLQFFLGEQVFPKDVALPHLADAACSLGVKLPYDILLCIWGFAKDVKNPLWTDVNYMDHRGGLLHLTNQTQTKYLLNIPHVNVNMHDSRNKTPLIQAIRRREFATAKALLTRSDIDLNFASMSRFGFPVTSLTSAALSGNVELVEQILRLPSLDMLTGENFYAMAVIDKKVSFTDESMKQLMLTKIEQRIERDVGLALPQSLTDVHYLLWSFIKDAYLFQQTYGLGKKKKVRLGSEDFKSFYLFV